MNTRTNTLIIVESPKKAKSIKQMFKAEGWDSAATVGHMLDLPTKDLGVSIGTKGAKRNKIILNLELSKRGREQRDFLLRKVRQADRVILATDDDREGEAIAAHCIKELGLPQSTARIRFNSVTKKALLEAMANPGRVDRNLVEAQEARRGLDRVVGWLVSRKLSDRLRNELHAWVSIGRVQAPTLAAIAKQAAAHRDFIPSSKFQPGSGVKGQFFKLPDDPCDTREEAEAIAESKPAKAVAKREEKRMRVRQSRR